MSIEKFTKKDTLLHLYNQTLQSVTIAEVQVTLFKQKSSVSLDPQVAKDLTQWRIQLDQALQNLTLIAELLKKEEEAIDPERTLN